MRAALLVGVPEMAKGARRPVSNPHDIPLLAVEEHAAMERIAKRPLSNEEAQLLRRELVLIGAFEDWLDMRHAVAERRGT